MEVNSLHDTAADCLHFVTGFFEVISKSAPHIYHSALLLAPQPSIIQKLYSKTIYSPVKRVVTGIPTSWDSWTASPEVTAEDYHAGWSPCGRFIGVASMGGVEVRDPNNLETIFILKPPSGIVNGIPQSLTFSPNGLLLACTYKQ